ncbi:uncharacterized protein EI97DRAFT_461308 [Westerdykella ornata]|uniref:EamA domain-containing protein n=1 Tax=Westerdykella ornata TaxID=318751 RepID=A0A6A6JB84_WESOR|nr:uncharacterized protein EI97DRAFT_461308 [Westerdykella ornata]KAF2273238.1 hypothetical protein EI97DRAFT_461308 [Westerdykella ornata]
MSPPVLRQGTTSPTHDKPTDITDAPHVDVFIPVKSGADTLNVASLDYRNNGGRATSPTPSLISIDDLNNIRLGIPDTDDVDEGVVERSPSGHAASPLPATRPRSWKGKIQRSWDMNKGLALVMVSQIFGTLMNVTTRLLEIEGNEGKGYDPFQILFARMSITVVCASIYMWYAKTPHFPFGMKEVRPLLVARGLTGFFGVFGMYYSLQYLPLADATVITFLAPSLACWACSFLINEPFTRMQQIAAYVSLFGVVLIARPVSLFSSLSSGSSPPSTGDPDGGIISSNPTIGDNATAPAPASAADYSAVTPAQRAAAVGVAMLGVFGAAGAYTTIRWIGKRAHPLISVNYFATWCTIVSVVMMFALPGVGFLIPRGWRDWAYLLFLGICGFVMQFLLAAGLQQEKSSRATNMVYTQMLFALFFDKLVWGTTPGLLSIVGSSLILGSAIYVAMHKEDGNRGVRKEELGDEEAAGEEVRGLMSADGEEGRDSEELEMGRLRE